MGPGQIVITVGARVPRILNDQYAGRWVNVLFCFVQAVVSRLVSLMAQSDMEPDVGETKEHRHQNDCRPEGPRRAGPKPQVGYSHDHQQTKTYYRVTFLVADGANHFVAIHFHDHLADVAKVSEKNTTDDQSSDQAEPENYIP